MSQRHILGRIILVAWVLGCSACRIAIPTPAYRHIDKEAPAFKEAVATEKERLEKEGRSAAKAEARAVRNVTKEILREESGKRTAQVLPLSEALGKFELSRGCWAYVTTTTLRAKGKTTVDVVQFDAFQPDERLFTLISRDGQTPDEKTQETFRKTQLKAWKKAMEASTSTGRIGRKKRTEASAMWNTSGIADLTITSPESGGLTEYTFLTVPGRLPVVGEMPIYRSVYSVDATSNSVVRKTETFLAPWSVMGGVAKVKILDMATDYVQLEAALPPFPMKTWAHYHVSAFGIDSGEVEIEIVYRDYRRVKCYDDRFEVRSGIPDVKEFILPGI